MKKTFAFVLACSFCLTLPVFSQEVYKVNMKDIVAPIAPTLWGLFFEDINRGADGGVYAEMVENRSFDFPEPMMGWTNWPKAGLREGTFLITNQSAENAADPRFMSVSTMATDTVGLLNQGFSGMSFRKNLGYSLTLRYRQVIPGMHIRIFLIGAADNILANMSVSPENKTDWTEQAITLVPSDSSTNGKLLVVFEGAGKMDLDRVSLFPTNTWMGRKNGLRYDLVKKLEELHPAFLRFPGGCIVEGNQLANRYQWKQTIGPLDERQLLKSIWNDNVPERQTPDYFESFGLGFYEYFQLCEDIKASPLPIINCGMSCQFDAAEVVPIKDLQPFIQDALDLIEFANGDSTTVWGRKRIGLGHPESFHMQMLGVGNENWGPQYAERLNLFTKAINAKYPDIKLINATGYSRIEPVFKYMDSVLRARHADIIDEHFYSSPEWFLQNANRYDSYDRKGPKIFVGEYAAQSNGVGSLKNVNNLKTALSEAAFMTGIERNAGVVVMASYAPLFADVKDWQWTPNLIWFDNSRSYNTPNYYVQQLFSVNKGTGAVPLLLNDKPLEGQDSIWASAVVDESANELILKIVNMSAIPKQKTIELEGARLAHDATLTTLSDHNAGVVNSLEHPDAIAPETVNAITAGKFISIELKPYSLSVLRLPLK